MKKILGGKAVTAVVIALVVVMLGGIIALAVFYYENLDFLESQTTFLDGEYSVDDGEWKPIDNEKPINDRFHKIVFKGKLSEDAAFLFNNINIAAKNVWFTLKSADGVVLLEHNYYSEEQYLDDLYLAHIAVDHDPTDPYHDKEYFIEHIDRKYYFNMVMPDTPGYITETIPKDYITYGQDDDPELTLEIVNPYAFGRMSYSECFKVSLSQDNAHYIKFFLEAFPAVLLFVLVCFFGLFLFPIAGFILGKINYNYLTFGALCFFWGIYMIAQKTGGYLNMWISDGTVCMAIEMMCNYFFIISVLCYLKSNLEKPVSRIIGNFVTVTYTLLVVTAVVLHFTAVIDLYATSSNLFVCTAVATVVMMVVLFFEAGVNRRAIFILVSWTPLTLSIILDAINYYAQFTDIHFYYFGLTVTMIYQIIRLIRDMRRQYKEAIRYQQMQKELYEAKVSVMVSQIQPNFMYNALTSIAMMCQIDPDTAQEATVTFAKYLRGNMDSLKQTNPIPFEQELEHLKKYLYIEKLRFGKKLNIVYDIGTTDFVLPQLSIQPLVENAVKHGVGMKKKGGTVTIATRETDNAYEVIISDDGVGFDPTAEKKDDGRSHIGMENTQRRLKDMCGGEVVINSKIGEGTVATVILPKEGQKHEDTVS